MNVQTRDSGRVGGPLHQHPQSACSGSEGEVTLTLSREITALILTQWANLTWPRYM